MKPILLQEGDRLFMKKKHPCGGESFRVLRVGSDIRMVCITCGRDLTLPRIKLEPKIKSVIHLDETTKEPIHNDV